MTVSIFPSNRVCRNATYQFIDDGDEGKQVFLDREVERVTVFEVDRDLHESANILNLHELAGLAFAKAA